MGGVMSKKIRYYVQQYRPAYEAISKEVALLANHFSIQNKVKIHDLHLKGLFQFRCDDKISSHHFIYYPFTAWATRLSSKKNDINHIYTSLGDLPYLNTIDLKHSILTAAASCRIEKIKRRIKKLERLQKIVVESQKQKRELLSLGIDNKKIEIIYPPVDLSCFSYVPTKGKFTILNASCPTRVSDFHKRGIYLLLQAAQEKKPVQFTLLWRKDAFINIKNLTSRNYFSNVMVKNEIITDMNQEFAAAHCTIIPYTCYDDFLKLVPNSAIESLAAGKPLLVSGKTEMAAIVKAQKCGVVFEPTTKSLLKAIEELQRNYRFYQKNCRKTAKKYFSKETFIKRYEDIYNQIP